MKIHELLEAAKPFHVIYNLKGFDRNDPLHQQFQNAVSKLLPAQARDAGFSINIDPSQLWHRIQAQNWTSAASGKPFTASDPPRAIRKDTNLGFTNDNIEFILASEMKKIGYKKSSETKQSKLGSLPGYNADDPLHTQWLAGYKSTRLRIIRGNQVQGIEPAPFLITVDQAWQLINNQQWTSALSGQKFTPTGPDSPSLAKIDKDQAWDVQNVRYITRSENHPKGATYFHTLDDFDKSNPLHASFLRTYARAKYRAQTKNILFSISAKQAWDIIVSQDWKCALTQQPFNITEPRDPLAPSPDQINPSQGYTPGNVQYVTWLVNNSKAGLNNDQYRALCKSVVDHAAGNIRDIVPREEDPYTEPENLVKVRRGNKIFLRKARSSKYSGLNLGIALHKKLRDIYTNTYHVPAISSNATLKRINLPRNITLEDFLQKAIDQDWRCALTGVYLTTSGPNMISVDRIDPTGGYTADNIQFTTWVSNRAKTNMTVSEFLNLCKQVVQHSP